MNCSHNDKHVYALIMAGGEGTRFAPLSIPDRPKQFLNFIGGKTFIRQTFERILPIVRSENIFVSTNERFTPLVFGEIPELPATNIVAEPFKKNTAPALVYAAKLISAKDPQAIMICVPSDHYIIDEKGFRQKLNEAAELARSGYLVTLGMKPTWQSPDYGYICPKNTGVKWSEVARFIEKPDEATAKKYIAEGYLWNGGIFIWQTKVFLDEINKYVPELNFETTSPFEYFNNVPSISIDYAVMEKSCCVSVIPTDVGWSDVGTWEGLWRLSKEGVEMHCDVVKTMNKVLRIDPVDRSNAVLPRRIEKP